MTNSVPSVPETLRSYPRGHYKALSEEKRQQIRDLRNQGLKYREIAEQVGCHQSVIGRTLDPETRQRYREKAREYYLDHAETIKAKMRAYMAEYNAVNKGENKKAMQRLFFEDHPMYRTWSSMLNRCLNSKHSSYANYGKRGIKVDPKFEDLRTYEQYIYALPACKHGLTGNPATGGKCKNHCTIDRIDNDLGYQPGNLRWATPSQQQSNKRRSR